MDREKNLLKNTVILAIGTFMPKMAAYFTLPILTGYLTKVEYGTYDLTTVLVSLVLPIATLQVQTGIFRYVIDVRNDINKTKKYISTGLIFIVFSSLIALLGLTLALYKIDLHTRILIDLYFFADIMVNALRQISRGINHNIEYSISAIISSICKLVLVIVFVIQKALGLDGAIISLALSSTISFIALFISIRASRYIDLRLFDKGCLMEMLNYSWPMVPNNMSMWATKLSNRLVIVFFLGTAANAVYSVANKIPNLLTLAQSTFSMAWHENASIYSKDKDANEYYSKMYRVMFDLISGVLSLLVCMTPILFKILIKGDYNDAYYQMPLLFLSMCFYSLSTFFGGIYVAIKQTKSVGLTTIYAAVINIVIDVCLIRFIGLYAASIASLISYVFLYIYRIIDIRKYVNVTIDYRHVFIVLLVIVLQCVMCFMQKQYLNYANYVIGLLLFIVLNISLIKSVLSMMLSLFNSKK